MKILKDLLIKLCTSAGPITYAFYDKKLLINSNSILSIYNYIWSDPWNDIMISNSSSFFYNNLISLHNGASVYTTNRVPASAR